jgi:hypothetical protein
MASPEALRILRELQSKPDNKVKALRGRLCAISGPTEPGRGARPVLWPAHAAAWKEAPKPAPLRLLRPRSIAAAEPDQSQALAAAIGAAARCSRSAAGLRAQARRHMQPARLRCSRAGPRGAAHACCPMHPLPGVCRL